jgi:hypothetical protein
VIICIGIWHGKSTTERALSHHRAASTADARAHARSLSTHARARARTHTHTHKGGRGGGGFLLGETRIADDGGDGIEGHVGHELSEHLVFILVRTDSFYFCL